MLIRAVKRLNATVAWLVFSRPGQLRGGGWRQPAFEESGDVAAVWVERRYWPDYRLC